MAPFLLLLGGEDKIEEGGGGLHWTGHGGAGHGGVLAGVGDGALQRGRVWYVL
jgi:hypothetical protein